MCNFTRYKLTMNENFKHKGLKRFWEKGDASKIPSEMIKRITMILDLLDSLEEVPQDLEPFRNLRPHPLKGDLEGFWSLDVTGNYRIIFRFENKNAYDIDLLDTH